MLIINIIEDKPMKMNKEYLIQTKDSSLCSIERLNSDAIVDSRINIDGANPVCDCIDAHEIIIKLCDFILSGKKIGDNDEQQAK